MILFYFGIETEIPYLYVIKLYLIGWYVNQNAIKIHSTIRPLINMRI
jgi:hypothetical protein